jgi:hypothetical protein
MDTIHLAEPRVNRTRFSIADLLLLMAAVGAVLLFVQGMLPGLPRDGSSLESRKLIGLAVVSGLIFLFSYGAVVGKTWKSRSTSLGIFFLLLLVFGVLSWHQVSWLVLGIVVSIVLGRVDRSKTLHLQLLVGWLVASALLASLLNHYFPSGRVQNLLAARAAYPIKDLSTRLPEVSKGSLSSQAESKVKLSESRLRKELNPFYADKSERNKRTNALRRAHDREYERFVRSLGFGPIRMSSVSRWSIDLPEIVDLNFDAVERKPKKDHHLLTPVYSDEARFYFDSPRSLPDLFKRSYLDFLNPATFGWAAAPKKVAGFEPHAFRFPITQVSIKSQTYAIRRLELIGLLMSDDPRVYVMDHLPRMDQIAESAVPTRPLNEFEAAALKKLLSGEDLVVDEQPNQIQMVGALRSLESCASCHDSESGDLMGAFSYDLVKK